MKGFKVIISRNLRKLAHTYRKVAESPTFEVENFFYNISKIREFKGDVELYHIDSEIIDFPNISDRDKSRLYSLIAKERDLLPDVELTETEVITALIELYERNPTYGFDASKFKEAFYSLRGNNFQVPGMKDLA